MKHEEKCKKNPEHDRPCFHCKYLRMRTIEYGEYDPNGQFSPPRGNALYCKKQDQFIYPPYIKKPYLAEEDPDMNIAMPKTCDLQQEI